MHASITAWEVELPVVSTLEFGPCEVYGSGSALLNPHPSVRTFFELLIIATRDGSMLFANRLHMITTRASSFDFPANRHA